jgi:hypothetical protein
MLKKQFVSLKNQVTNPDLMMYTCCWLLTLDMNSIETGWKFWRICRLGAQFLLTLHSHLYAFLPAWDFMKDYNYHEMLKKGQNPWCMNVFQTESCSESFVRPEGQWRWTATRVNLGKSL